MVVTRCGVGMLGPWGGGGGGYVYGGLGEWVGEF